MKHFIASVLLVLSLSGCSYIPNKAELDYEEEKLQLERQVELLLLKKRKAILEKQLDAISNTDLEFAPAQEGN